MSENIRVTESPKHFMVLDAVSRGVANSGKISKVTKLDKAEVEMVLHDLATQRLVIAEEKKGLFGKKIEARITETGSELLYSKKQELEEKAAELKGLYRNGDRGQLQSFMDDNRSWIPMMLFSGIMSAMIFASMMSFMGMAMNPAESAMAGDAANAEAGAADASAGSDASGGAAEDSGASDMGAADGGGFDGGGDFGGDFSF